jgi:hypothetical protein
VILSFFALSHVPLVQISPPFSHFLSLLISYLHNVFSLLQTVLATFFVLSALIFGYFGTAPDIVCNEFNYIRSGPVTLNGKTHYSTTIGDLLAPGYFESTRFY